MLLIPAAPPPIRSAFRRAEPDGGRQRRGDGPTSAGQITRDAVDNLMQPYIDDTFYRLTGLNLRLTVGSDGFQGRVRKRISRRLNLQADYLQGFYGNSRWTAQGDVWLADYVTLGGRLEQIRTGRRSWACRRRSPSTACWSSASTTRSGRSDSSELRR